MGQIPASKALRHKKQKQSQLNPTIYSARIARFNGRLVNSDLTEESKIPILLLRTENFIKLLIIKIYGQTCHGGVFTYILKIKAQVLGTTKTSHH